MAKFDGGRIFEEAYPGLAVAARIRSAVDYQKIIEEFLPLIRNQMTLRFSARIKRDYPGLGERNLVDEYEGHNWIVSGLLPGLLAGSVLVAIWAAFERGAEDIARYVQTKENVSLALDNLREQDLCARLLQYLRTLTRQEFKFADTLSDIQFLRNVYAHHNGSIEHLSEKNKKRLGAIVRSKKGVSLYDKHQLVVSTEFLRASAAQVDDSLSDLIKFIEDRYPDDGALED